VSGAVLRHCARSHESATTSQPRGGVAALAEHDPSRSADRAGECVRLHRLRSGLRAADPHMNARSLSHQRRRPCLERCCVALPAGGGNGIPPTAGADSRLRCARAAPLTRGDVLGTCRPLRPGSRARCSPGGSRPGSGARPANTPDTRWPPAKRPGRRETTRARRCTEYKGGRAASPSDDDNRGRVAGQILACRWRRRRSAP